MNLAGYIRVSSEQQVDAYGKDLQRKHIVDWAVLTQHVNITEWFEEDAVSGKTEGADRPVLRGILDRADEFDGIVFFDPTRIARLYVVQETLLALLWSSGLRVFTTTTGEMSADEEDPTKILIRQIMGIIAEFDHRSIVRKLTAAKKLKAAAGGYIGGIPRYGTDVVGVGKESMFVTNEEETRAINQIMECHYQGMSLRAIAGRMNQFGIRSKTGKQWYASGIQRIIEREGHA